VSAFGFAIALRGWLPALALIFSLSGCGSNGEPDKQRFAAATNEICQLRVDRIRKTHGRGGYARAGADIKIAEAYEAELHQLRSVQPPSDLAPEFRRLLELYAAGTRSQRTFADRMSRVSKSTDSASYNDQLDQAREAGTATRRFRTRGNDIARAIGLKACGTALY
jgi:hypothetical protein